MGILRDIIGIFVILMGYHRIIRYKWEYDGEINEKKGIFWDFIGILWEKRGILSLVVSDSGNMIGLFWEMLKDNIMHVSVLETMGNGILWDIGFTL